MFTILKKYSKIINMEEKMKLGQKHAGLSYTIALLISALIDVIIIGIISLVAKDYQQKAWYLYIAYAISPISIFITLLIITKKFNVEIKGQLGVKNCNYKYYLLGIAMFLGAFFGLGFLNFIELLAKIGFEIKGTMPPLNNGYQLALTIIIVCIMPAVFEELLFRSVILGGTKGLGTVKAILLNGFLFSLFHTNPAQTIYQFIMGCAFSIIAIKSGSVLPSVIMHFLNNLVVILFLYFAPGLNVFYWYTIAIGLVLFVGSMVYLIFFDKNKAKKEESSAQPLMIFSLVGIVYAVLMWVVGLISCLK